VCEKWIYICMLSWTSREWDHLQSTCLVTSCTHSIVSINTFQCLCHAWKHWCNDFVGVFSVLSSHFFEWQNETVFSLIFCLYHIKSYKRPKQDAVIGVLMFVFWPNMSSLKALCREPLCYFVKYTSVTLDLVVKQICCHWYSWPSWNKLVMGNSFNVQKMMWVQV